MIKYIDELKKEDLAGKRVLLRLDLNAPIVDGEIKDVSRLESVIPTVDFLRINDAKVIIIAHAENKDGENESLIPILHHLNGYFKTEFCPTYFTGEAIEKVLKMEDKSVLLFENVRTNPGEKENDPDFAHKLSQMADIYVNDAFSVSHRKHASVVGVPQYIPHYGGLHLKSEIENLSKAFSPEHPFVFILGGAKFETKIPLVKKYLNKADTIFIGGALANDIYKAKGLEVGGSLVSKSSFDGEDLLSSNKVLVPVDVTVADKEGVVSFKKPEEVNKSDCIVDAGPETLEQLKDVLNDAKTIIWNGPLGNYEKGFSDKTESLVEIIASLTEGGALSVVGGGDTVASIQKMDIGHKFSFVSTGGGAMMDYLVNETLPGIEALEK
ncbi:MAG: phosphoglycerate kinase [Patescibacteria group bacterium]